MYVIHPRSPACGQPGNRNAAAIEVYGIGAGPRAVGAVAIDNLSFGPARPRFPNEQVAIGYEARNQFNHGSVEILRYDVTTPGVINVQRVKTSRTDPVQVGPNPGGAWHGMGATGNRSTGVPRRTVRGGETEMNAEAAAAAPPR